MHHSIIFDLGVLFHCSGLLSAKSFCLAPLWWTCCAWCYGCMGEWSQPWDLVNTMTCDSDWEIHTEDSLREGDWPLPPQESRQCLLEEQLSGFNVRRQELSRVCSWAGRKGVHSQGSSVIRGLEIWHGWGLSRTVELPSVVAGGKARQEKGQGLDQRANHCEKQQDSQEWTIPIIKIQTWCYYLSFQGTWALLCDLAHSKSKPGLLWFPQIQ